MHWSLQLNPALVHSVNRCRKRKLSLNDFLRLQAS
jgi:hypothetical protein